ncbi:MAG: PEP-CTERM sorting domain-containing protein [Geobacteraceae bacterium]
MKTISTVSFIFLFLFAGALAAHAYTIDDTYIGANPSGFYPQWETADVIGPASVFQIHGMDISITGNQLSSVKIYTEYVKPLSDIGASGTQLGDLFISTNGYTSGASTSDTWQTGEKWEYALVFDNHLPTSSSGTINLYKVAYGVSGGQGNILLTNNFKQPDWAVYRECQETRINTQLTDYYLGNIGTWGIDSTNGILSFDITGNGWLKATDFGFHWNMTCGNDTIEGGASAPVPEPSTLLLLGSGLLGLAFCSKRRTKA